MGSRPFGAGGYRGRMVAGIVVRRETPAPETVVGRVRQGRARRRS